MPGRELTVHATGKHVGRSRRSEDAAERVAFEQVAELQVSTEHVVALVPAEPLQLRGIYAAIYAGGERAELQALDAKLTPSEAGRDGPGLYHEGHGLGGQRLRAEAGQGRRVVGALPLCPLDPPEHRAIDNAGRSQPALQGAHRAQLGVVIGGGDHDGFGLAALCLVEREAEAAFGRLKVADMDRGQI